MESGASQWEEKIVGEGTIRREVSIIKNLSNFDFAPLVNEKLNLIAELKVILLRPEPPGSILTQSGDINNRLKTLFDALKMPDSTSALPNNEEPQEGETPFFCLLEDDNLVSKVSVQTDRLLEPSSKPSEVEMFIYINTKAIRASWANMGLG